MWGWGYWGWGWWFWVFWAFIIFLIFWGISSSAWAGRRVPPEEQILRERYARGEITKQEFDDRLKDLRRAA